MLCAVFVSTSAHLLPLASFVKNCILGSASFCAGLKRPRRSKAGAGAGAAQGRDTQPCPPQRRVGRHARLFCPQGPLLWVTARPRRATPSCPSPSARGQRGSFLSPRGPQEPAWHQGAQPHASGAQEEEPPATAATASRAERASSPASRALPVFFRLFVLALLKILWDPRKMSPSMC